MSKINCIIVEDEPLAVKVLADYIAEVPFLQLQQVFKDAISATEWLHDNKTDLLFLDIHLPKLKGMAFLRTLVNAPSVIITTAYHQYAVEGFDLNVADYLLKPIEFERFLVAVNKVKAAKTEQQTPLVEDAPKDHLFVNMNKKRVKILFADILYLESQMDYVKIVTTKRSYLASLTTTEIEKLLPAKLFKRVHRSYIISINRIDSYTSEIVEINGVQIPIGRSYRGIIEEL
jgi:two-component system LytT family response regulator